MFILACLLQEVLFFPAMKPHQEGAEAAAGAAAADDVLPPGQSAV